jgi:hypothetical protein
MNPNEVFSIIACLAAIHAIYRGYQRRVLYQILDGILLGLLVACVQSQCHWLVGVLVQLVWTYFKRSAEAERERIRLHEENKENKRLKRLVPPSSAWEQVMKGRVGLRTEEYLQTIRPYPGVGPSRIVETYEGDPVRHNPDQQKRMREQHRERVAGRS